MSDMAMHAHETDGGADDAKGTATLAMLLWVAVVLSLAYGLYNTVIKVVDLFTG
jgi:hypothetical protein